MCGIAGIFGKTETERERLGADLASMMLRLSHRGPDGAGYSLYADDGPGRLDGTRISLLGRGANGTHLSALVDLLEDELGPSRVLAADAGQAVVAVEADPSAASAWLNGGRSDLTVLSVGAAIETFKCVGPPENLIETTGLGSRTGTHAIAHTRMATESRVSINHSHPFSPGADLCLVHNGSLSNHHAVRRKLRSHGIPFETDNDSEVAARYIGYEIAAGATLEQALESAKLALDGFYTFVVGNAEGIAVLRDPVACKPGVIAETDDWIAVASEQAALEVLPASEHATFWEAEPGHVYSWSTDTVAA